MKANHILAIICAVLICGVTSKSYSQNSNDDIFTVVEVSPSFVGGEAAMNKFLTKNLTYPREALEQNIEGTVYVSFIVEADGSITNATIKRDIGAGCGEEAVRVVKMMPKWNPGKQRGKTVRTQFILPVSFKLS
jgi:periplasmic protein TonB